MKIFFTTFITSFVIISSITFSQFQPDMRLTNDTSNSYKCLNNSSGIATNGNFVHVVWSDFRTLANEKVFYKRSTDWGITWGADTQLVYGGGSSAVYPVIATVGSAVYILWQDHRSGGGKTFYKFSVNDGTTWGPDVQLSLGTTSFSEFPSLAVSGPLIFAVWQDDRDGNEEIYYRFAADGGYTWGQESRLTNDAGTSDHPSVSILGTTVHVVWVDNRDGNKEIYYKRSADGGMSWGADTRLTSDPSESNYPSISASGSVLYVTWQDLRNGWEIYGKRSIDGGLTWEADTRLTNDVNNSFYPAVIASGTNLHIVWQDLRNSNWEIYYKRSLDGGLTWEPDTRLTTSGFDSFLPSVTVSGPFVDVFWEDNRDGNFEMYFKRDPTGNPIGLINISSEVPQAYTLSQNYPNPFNPATNIKFEVPKQSNIKIVVYDNLGREISTLVNMKLNPGTYKVDWDASNYPSGVYFYRLTAVSYSETKKMVLVK